MFRRKLLAAIGSSLCLPLWAADREEKVWDVIVVGTGVAGLSALALPFRPELKTS